MSETSGFEEERTKPEQRRLFRNNFERAKRTTISVDVSPVSTKVRVESPQQDVGVPSEYSPALSAVFLMPGAISHPIVGVLPRATRDPQMHRRNKANTIYLKTFGSYIPKFIRAVLTTEQYQKTLDYYSSAFAPTESAR